MSAKSKRSLPRSPWLGVVLAAAGAFSAAPSPGATGAVELPTFRPGQWKFERTVETRTGGAPTTLSSTRCADPTAEMQKANALVASKKCVFAPLQKAGNLYTFSADCTIQGKTLNSLTLLTVESATSYRLQVNTHGMGSATKETVVATRIGDCKK